MSSLHHFQVHFSLNELENDAKMTSKRRSNKINLLSLSFVTNYINKL